MEDKEVIEPQRNAEVAQAYNPERGVSGMYQQQEALAWERLGIAWKS